MVATLLVIAAGLCEPHVAHADRVPDEHASAVAYRASDTGGFRLRVAVGRMAVVVAELHQVADANRPRDQAFQSPLHPGERGLRTLGESRTCSSWVARPIPTAISTGRSRTIRFQAAAHRFGGRESQSSTEPASRR